MDSSVTAGIVVICVIGLVVWGLSRRRKKSDQPVCDVYSIRPDSNKEDDTDTDADDSGDA
jgi:hypothetical protein